jgi:hypothetical protein
VLRNRPLNSSIVTKSGDGARMTGNSHLFTAGARGGMAASGHASDAAKIAAITQTEDGSARCAAYSEADGEG